MSRGGRGKRPQGFARVAESLLAYVEKLSNAIHGGWRRAVAVALTVILSLQMVLSGGLSQAVAYAYAEQQAYEAASQPVAIQSDDGSAADAGQDSSDQTAKKQETTAQPVGTGQSATADSNADVAADTEGNDQQGASQPEGNIAGGGLLRKALRRTAR